MLWILTRELVVRSRNICCTAKNERKCKCHSGAHLPAKSVSSNWNKVKKWNFSFGSFSRFLVSTIRFSFYLFLFGCILACALLFRFTRFLFWYTHTHMRRHYYVQFALEKGRKISRSAAKNLNGISFVFLVAQRKNEKWYDNKLLYEKINWHFSHGWLMKISDFFSLLSSPPAWHWNRHHTDSLQHFRFLCKNRFAPQPN